MSVSLKLYAALRSINASEEAAMHVVETMDNFLKAHHAKQPDAESKFQAVLSEIRLLHACLRTQTVALPQRD
jgi:hypothetical protein